MHKQIKLWKINSDYNKKITQNLEEALGIDQIISVLLSQRGITNYQEAKEFFRPDINLLHNPFLMKGMSNAVNRILKAINENEKILVFGDYDVDGTTAVALFYSFIRDTYSNIDFYIPDRYAEGYGISFAGIDYAQKNNCKLIVALDCGIKSVDKVDYANKKGIDFIICDHHLPGEILPDAIAILDPKQLDCPYPYKELSGCGLGFKLAQAICMQTKKEITEIYKYLDLVAISIAADIVPITGENRILAHHGLVILNQLKRPGIKALLENVKVEKDITISNVVFIIAPRINAAGRVAHGSNSVKLLITDNIDEAKKIAKQINTNNLDRRAIDLEITQQALEMIERDASFSNRKSTVLFNQKWHKGVVGIVASRLIEHYYQPTIVLTESNEQVVGSARSVKDYDVYKAIEACADLLLQFGGHKYAAGLVMKKENVSTFIRRFDEIVSSTISADNLIPKEEIDLQINFNQINEKNFRILRQLSPHGPENMSPIFCSTNVFDTGYAKIVGTNHLKLELFQENNFHDKFSAIAFGMGDYLSFFLNRRPAKICFELKENEFQNKKIIQLVIKGIVFD